MDIPLDVEVRCTDNVCGRSTVIVMNPVSKEVTHFVLKTKGFIHDEFLVPVDLITESTPQYIRIRCASEQLDQLEPFKSSSYRALDDLELGNYMPGGAMIAWPYVTADETYAESAGDLFTNIEKIPHDELAIHRGSHVEATDGHIGIVDEFLVDRTDNHITHLILRESHVFNKKHVTIPLSAIDRIEEDTVYLNLDRESVAQITAVPIAR